MKINLNHLVVSNLYFYIKYEVHYTLHDVTHFAGKWCCKTAWRGRQSCEWFILLLLLCLQPDSRGRSAGNGSVFSVFSGWNGTPIFPFPVPSADHNVSDKMALYNFKKIMVVPTAKVCFMSCLLRVLKCCGSACFVAELWEKVEVRNNMVGICREGKHVLCCCVETETRSVTFLTRKPSANTAN